jgi:hypothetical protein
MLKRFDSIFNSSLKDISGCWIMPRLISFPLRPSYDALLPPAGFAGVPSLPWFAKGEAGIGFLGLSCFGFFASRLPRFSPLAMECLRC